METIITGATGFIGKVLIAHLLKKKIIPTIIIRDDSNLSDELKKCKIIKMDLKDIENIPFQTFDKYDNLIHLAWGGLPNYNENYHLESELPTQVKFLSHLIHLGLKNIFVTGTCFEYGLKENEIRADSELFPINAYGKAKVQLNMELCKLQEEKKFNLIWARLFYLYGKGQSKKTLLGQLEDAIKKNKKIFNMSNGDQLRDYFEVNELVKKIINLTMRQKNLGSINLCSGNPIKVKNLVKKVCRENNWKISLNLGYYEISNNEPKNFWGIPFDEKKIKFENNR